MTTLLCPKHGDPRDTSVMRPQEAPCNCDMQMQVGHDLCVCGHTRGTHSHGMCQLKGCKCLDYFKAGVVEADPVTDYTFMDHLRAFYPAEYKRRVREASE